MHFASISSCHDEACAMLADIYNWFTEGFDAADIKNVKMLLNGVRELIALLDKEYGWKTNESAVTGHLYTRRDKFVHTPPDHTGNRPVTWSSK